MFEEYKKIFDQRGYIYQKAMTDYPHARDEEFMNIIDHSDIEDGNVVLDLASAGGYLKKFIEREVTLVSMDFTTEFFQSVNPKREDKVVIASGQCIPLGNGTVNRFLSLAGLHHVPNLVPVMEEAYRMLSDDGRFCFAEVLEGTPPARFLNEFIDQNSSMGHKGTFFDEKTKPLLKSCGLEAEIDRLKKYHWKFDSLDDMAKFCRLLFGIDQASPEKILEGIQNYLGIEKISNQYCLNWELTVLAGGKV